MKQVKVLFVCLGNICRSPTAEGVFQKIVDDEGLSEQILIDSCGTSDWHVGESPDRRSTAAARKRGYDLSRLRGRQVSDDDFDFQDYILPMDDNNLRDLQLQCPSHFSGELNLFLDYSEQSAYSEVPDPYSYGTDAFELVLDLVEDASRGLLDKIRKEHGI